MLCTRFFLFTIVISLETSKVQQNILQQEERFFGSALKKNTTIKLYVLFYLLMLFCITTKLNLYRNESIFSLATYKNNMFLFYEVFYVALKNISAFKTNSISPRYFPNLT